MDLIGLGPRLNAATITVPRNPAMAETMYERVAEAITTFQKELDAEHEVGAHLTNLGASFTIRIENIGYHNPFLFKIFGVTQDGHRCTLLQHVSQLNILLVALPAAHKPARRIGFATRPTGDTAVDPGAGGEDEPDNK